MGLCLFVDWLRRIAPGSGAWEQMLFVSAGTYAQLGFEYLAEMEFVAEAQGYCDGAHFHMRVVVHVQLCFFQYAVGYELMDGRMVFVFEKDFGGSFADRSFCRLWQN